MTRIVSRFSPSLIIAAAMLAAPCEATVYTGTIAQIGTAQAANDAFRVYLSPAVTGCANPFLYINTSDDNYQARVASLLTAYALGKNVQITATTDGVGNCVFNYFVVY